MELCILVPGISSQHHGSGGPEQQLHYLLITVTYDRTVFSCAQCFSYSKKM